MIRSIGIFSVLTRLNTYNTYAICFRGNVPNANRFDLLRSFNQNGVLSDRSKFEYFLQTANPNVFYLAKLSEVVDCKLIVYSSDVLKICQLEKKVYGDTVKEILIKDYIPDKMIRTEALITNSCIDVDSWIGVVNKVGELVFTCQFKPCLADMSRNDWVWERDVLYYNHTEQYFVLLEGDIRHKAITLFEKVSINIVTNLCLLERRILVRRANFDYIEESAYIFNKAERVWKEARPIRRKQILGSKRRK